MVLRNEMKNAIWEEEKIKWKFPARFPSQNKIIFNFQFSPVLVCLRRILSLFLFGASFLFLD